MMHKVIHRALAEWLMLSTQSPCKSLLCPNALNWDICKRNLILNSLEPGNQDEGASRLGVW